MTDATQRFTGKVAAYAQYRERYAPEVILPVLQNWCGLTGAWSVADIGAGTGMLSDVFLANGNSVTAVEPNTEMREACQALHPDNPKFTIVSGTAEHTSLLEASTDLVGVGRALHWFDLKTASQEFKRILKPDGWVVILAYGRAKDGTEENTAFQELLNISTNTAAEIADSHEIYRHLEGFFAPNSYRHAEISGEITLDWEELRGLCLSFSYVPLPGAPEFQPFETALEEFYKRYEQRGRIKFKTQYWINAGRL